MEINKLTGKVIGCAIEVHKNLGPGLLEGAYEQCLAYELRKEKIPFEKQKPLPIKYKEVHLDCGYRLDFLVDNRLILELKALDAILPVHKAQVISYLKLSNVTHGLLINFNVPILKDGIQRFVL